MTDSSTNEKKNTYLQNLFPSNITCDSFAKSQANVN